MIQAERIIPAVYASKWTRESYFTFIYLFIYLFICELEVYF